MIVRETVSPFTDTVPVVDAIFPARVAKSVVFPAPLENEIIVIIFQFI